MGVGTLPAISAQLQAHGLPGDTPAALIERATLPDQRTVIGTLATLPELARRHDVRAPALKMFDKKTEALLQRAENSDSADLQEQADAVRMRVETGWREARDRELDSADQVMVDRYGNAITLARRYNVQNPAIAKAIQRLAFFTDVIGEAKLSQYTGRVPSLEYSPGLFLRLRPGLVTAPRPEGMAPPAPPPAP